MEFPGSTAGIVALQLGKVPLPGTELLPAKTGRLITAVVAQPEPSGEKGIEIPPTGMPAPAC